MPISPKLVQALARRLAAKGKTADPNAPFDYNQHYNPNDAISPEEMAYRNSGGEFQDDFWDGPYQEPQGMREPPELALQDPNNPYAPPGPQANNFGYDKENRFFTYGEEAGLRQAENDAMDLPSGVSREAMDAYEAGMPKQVSPRVGDPDYIDKIIREAQFGNRQPTPEQLRVLERQQGQDYIGRLLDDDDIPF